MQSNSYIVPTLNEEDVVIKRNSTRENNRLVNREAQSTMEMYERREVNSY